MLEKHFSDPRTLRRLRSGLSGPYIDGFARLLAEEGYAHATAIRYIRAAARLGVFVQRRHGVLTEINVSTLQAFRRHLIYGRCPRGSGGKTGYHAYFGVKLFHRYLIQRGICPSPPPAPDTEHDVPSLVSSFATWYQIHRGITQPTVRLYSRGATELLAALGKDVRTWSPQDLRTFLLDHAKRSGAETTQKLITSVRAFLRYLSFCGEARPDLDRAIPAIAHWRLASLPRCLAADELKRLIAACDGDSPTRRRDRAIILLLSRLGLRAGDVAQLRGPDVDWQNGTLQVMGKGRYQVRLPLPQDAGDALLRYLRCRPQVEHTDRIFLRCIAPFRPFMSGDGVSGVVSRALQRAGIEAPTQGAHLLRHTAATEMLRNGVSLDKIGLVLRHRSIDMSAYYAKVDVDLLRQIAQPWPEVKP